MQKRGPNVSKWSFLFLAHFSETTGQFGLFIGMFFKKFFFVDRMYTKETRCQKGGRLSEKQFFLIISHGKLYKHNFIGNIKNKNLSRFVEG
jgi:hypothetical protein